MARALQMSMGSRLGSCDPLAFTVRPRDLPVKRRREFQSNIWPAEGLLGEETHHRGLRLLLPYARRDADPRFPESPDTPAAGARIGIVGGHHYPAHARFDEQMAACGSTGRIMEARFKCDIGSGPACQFARLHESHGFGVWASSLQLGKQSFRERVSK